MKNRKEPCKKQKEKPERGATPARQPVIKNCRKYYTKKKRGTSTSKIVQGGKPEGRDGASILKRGQG